MPPTAAVFGSFLFLFFFFLFAPEEEEELLTQRRQASLSAGLTGAPMRTRSSILSIILLVLRHEGEDIHQLFCHQRHRSIERRHDRRTVDELLHGAPVGPLLRADVGETVRPRPAGLFFIEAEELRLGCVGRGGGGGPGSWSCSSTRAPTPRPWHSSVPVRNGA